MAIGGFVAGAYIAGDLHDPARVVLGAIVALGPGQLVSLPIWRHRPWDALVASQLWSYEKPDGPGDLNTIIRSEDFERASKALRRAKLNPCGCTHMPTSPPGPSPTRAVPTCRLLLCVDRLGGRNVSLDIR